MLISRGTIVTKPVNAYLNSLLLFFRRIFDNYLFFSFALHTTKFCVWWRWLGL